MTTSSATRYIDPAVLMQLRSLELRIKAVMEGFMTGLHRSPLHGFSVEFTEYRQYAAGDDLRYLDWKVLARSDRSYIRLYEDETNLRCHLLVDNSRSMSFGSRGFTKADYAKTLAACLAWFLLQQRDATGLILFDERVDDVIPARFRIGQLRHILASLEKTAGGQSTDLTQPLEHAAAQIRRRGMVVLISDLLAPIEGFEKSLSWLAAAGHQLAVFQILDPAEWNFEFDDPSLFFDLETGREVYVDPQAAKAGYRARLEQHQTAVRELCAKFGVTYEFVTTDRPLEMVLFEFLQLLQHARLHGVRRSGRRT